MAGGRSSVGIAAAKALTVTVDTLAVTTASTVSQFAIIYSSASCATTCKNQAKHFLS
jgi:hypothetical protein